MTGDYANANNKRGLDGGDVQVDYKREAGREGLNADYKRAFITESGLDVDYKRDTREEAGSNVDYKRTLKGDY